MWKKSIFVGFWLKKCQKWPFLGFWGFLETLERKGSFWTGFWDLFQLISRPQKKMSKSEILWSEGSESSKMVQNLCFPGEKGVPGPQTSNFPGKRVYGGLQTSNLPGKRGVRSLKWGGVIFCQKSSIFDHLRPSVLLVKQHILKSPKSKCCSRLGKKGVDFCRLRGSNGSRNRKTSNFPGNSRSEISICKTTFLPKIVDFWPFATLCFTR